MSDIFVSYASEDRELAESLIPTLSGGGRSVFWDRTILPGNRFAEVIERELHTARCIVVLWTQNSVKSDWVLDEATLARKRRVLVPVTIGPVEPPFGFRQIQAALFPHGPVRSGDAPMRSLLSSIDTILGSAPTGTSAPKSHAEAPVSTQFEAKLVSRGWLSADWMISIDGRSILLQWRVSGFTNQPKVLANGERLALRRDKHISSNSSGDLWTVTFDLKSSRHFYPTLLQVRPGLVRKYRLTIDGEVVFDEF